VSATVLVISAVLGLAMMAAVLGVAVWAIVTQRADDGRPLALRRVPAAWGERITRVSFHHRRRRLRRPGHIRPVRPRARRR
jgi:hypothetical protein